MFAMESCQAELISKLVRSAFMQAHTLSGHSDLLWLYREVRRCEEPPQTPKSNRMTAVSCRVRDQLVEQELIYEKLPKDIASRHVLLMDPILATGNSAARAIQASWLVQQQNSRTLCQLSALHQSCLLSCNVVKISLQR